MNEQQIVDALLQMARLTKSKEVNAVQGSYGPVVLNLTLLTDDEMKEVVSKLKEILLK